MKKKNSAINDTASRTGVQIGSALASNVQAGSNAAMDGMSLLRFKAGRIANVGYEQGKGNLFEYIESAKLNRNMANMGKTPFDKNTVTDLPKHRGGFGENTAPDDFRMVKGGRTVGRAQAKFNNNPHDAAVNFVNPKYTDMQRIAPKDQVQAIQDQLDAMLRKGEISKRAFENASKNLSRNGLNDPSSGVSSGGTTTKELSQFRDNDGRLSTEAVRQYALGFELKQYAYETGVTTAYGAGAGAITNGIISGVQNLFMVYNDEKELKKALKDIGVDVVKGGTRGAGTGALSSILRIGGTKAKIPVISNANAAAVVAGGIIDIGVALYGYGRGEIDAPQLQKELQNTAIKSVSTIYFTKALAVTLGAVNPFITMGIYTIASYAVTCVREIITNAKLNAEEYRRMAALNKEFTALLEEYRARLEVQISACIEKRRNTYDTLLASFEANLSTGENYDEAVYAIIAFADQTGIYLQHADINDFDRAMLSDNDFVLK